VHVDHDLASVCQQVVGRQQEVLRLGDILKRVDADYRVEPPPGIKVLVIGALEADLFAGVASASVFDCPRIDVHTGHARRPALLGEDS